MESQSANHNTHLKIHRCVFVYIYFSFNRFNVKRRATARATFYCCVVVKVCACAREIQRDSFTVFFFHSTFSVLSFIQIWCDAARSNVCHCISVDDGFSLLRSVYISPLNNMSRSPLFFPLNIRRISHSLAEPPIHAHQPAPLLYSISILYS